MAKKITNKQMFDVLRDIRRQTRELDRVCRTHDYAEINQLSLQLSATAGNLLHEVLLENAKEVK
jgi:hypothetical protein